MLISQHRTSSNLERVMSVEEPLFVRRGGALVESMPLDRRVAGLNPALAATQRPWASHSLAVACSASACKIRHNVSDVLWSGALLKGLGYEKRYGNG